MRLLAYGILLDEACPHVRTVLGLNGEPVSLARQGSLAVAHSPVSPAFLEPSLKHLRQYAAVVEALHRVAAVLPMRYGCCFETETEMQLALREHAGEYAAALKEAEGCVELGVRVLLQGPAGVQSTTARPPEASGKLSGVGYLLRRRQRFAETDRRKARAQREALSIMKVFHGLYVRCSYEFSVGTSSFIRVPMLSLYFLVMRAQEHAFRVRFHAWSKENRGTAILSGPWPPYNFVPTPARAVSASKQLDCRGRHEPSITWNPEQ